MVLAFFVVEQRSWTISRNIEQTKELRWSLNQGRSNSKSVVRHLFSTIESALSRAHS